MTLEIAVVQFQYAPLKKALMACTAASVRASTIRLQLVALPAGWAEGSNVRVFHAFGAQCVGFAKRRAPVCDTQERVCATSWPPLRYVASSVRWIVNACVDTRHGCRLRIALRHGCRYWPSYRVRARRQLDAKVRPAPVFETIAFVLAMAVALACQMHFYQAAVLNGRANGSRRR